MKRRAMGLADIARHVAGCHSTQQTRLNRRGFKTSMTWRAISVFVSVQIASGEVARRAAYARLYHGGSRRGAERSGNVGGSNSGGQSRGDIVSGGDAANTHGRLGSKVRRKVGPVRCPSRRVIRRSICASRVIQRMIYARHLIQRIICARHLIQRVIGFLNPRLLSQMAPDDVASDIGLGLP